MQDNHSTTSTSSNLSRGLEESFGKLSGWNNIEIIEDKSCSSVNVNPSAADISRGSEYDICTSGIPRPMESEQSPCSEVSVNDSSLNEETRHLIRNENSSNEPLQESKDSSSSHLASKSAISPLLIGLLAPYPEELARTQRAAQWAEEQWRRRVQKQGQKQS